VRKIAIIRYFGRSTIRQCAATLGLAREKGRPTESTTGGPFGPCPFAVERLYTAAWQAFGGPPLSVPRGSNRVVGPFFAILLLLCLIHRGHSPTSRTRRTM